MFTGIVEEIGTVHAVNRGNRSMSLTIVCTTVLADVNFGDSLAVNGVCLTVSSFTSTYFTADVMPETFQSTTLSKLQKGDKVNLERAMAMTSRFGGHIVSGHVDSIGKITSMRKHENALYMDIQLEESLLKYMIPKGSITIDGTSLTIFDVFSTGCTISLIPTTQQQSIIGMKVVGHYVNVECDILAKYVEQLCRPATQKQHQKDVLTMDTLVKNGFYA
ncbi:riboflavin synthase [Sporosarcina saromensis]|uniref:Riboflavin synthase n=1 Tax=Sporosarcina saromensis TaxID=359365 RepID=A0ABU4GD06_9BACL|nr:riboflavin synthase [Sporosarcina saromensis]MDW0114791.1 riboflavin synthase [Sporosarcina saromensis]